MYDEAGREVGRLIDEALAPGSYAKTFDGSGYASGVYFYVLESRSRNGVSLREMKKMLLIK